MKLNAKRKRQANKAKTREDRQPKWCPVPGESFGYHGLYTGGVCSKCCEKERTRR